LCLTARCRLTTGAEDLLFTGGSFLAHHVLFVSSFQGPGITATNLVLVPDADAAAAMPNYIQPSTAPAAVSANSSSSSEDSSRTSALPMAAIGAVIGAVVAVLLACVAAWTVQRYRQQSSQMQDTGAKDDVLPSSDGSIAVGDDTTTAKGLVSRVRQGEAKALVTDSPAGASVLQKDQGGACTQRSGTNSNSSPMHPKTRAGSSSGGSVPVQAG
jgi:hypothetical protein